MLESHQDTICNSLDWRTCVPDQKTDTFIFDFDSTLISVESFDEILAIAIGGDEETRRSIERITDAGMSGEIDLSESLERRLKGASICQADIDRFSDMVVGQITSGMPDVISLLQQRDQKVLILSGGFLETIYPVAERLSLLQTDCYANSFLKDGAGKITGIDFDNPLSRSDGKTKIICQLKGRGELPGTITCIGDGMSDAEPFVDGAAHQFWGFFQNRYRPQVAAKATLNFHSSGELLQHIESSLQE